MDEGVSSETQREGGERASASEAAQKKALHWRGEFAFTRGFDFKRAMIALSSCLGFGLAGTVLNAVGVPGIAIGVALGGSSAVMILLLTRLVLSFRRMNLFCPHCGKHIASDVEWRCGRCDKRSTDALRYSFLYKCEHCGAAPESYRCHHCGRLIFLTEQQAAKGGDGHAASKWEEIIPERQETAEERARRFEGQTTAVMRELELERATGELVETRMCVWEKLSARKRAIESGDERRRTPPKNKEEELRASLEKFNESKRAAHRIRQEAEEKVEEKYLAKLEQFKMDAEAREKAQSDRERELGFIDAWYEEQVKNQ